MYTVRVNGEEIARFKDGGDADHFASWKRDRLADKFAQEQLEKYLAEHPTTEYGQKTLPGDVPLSATYPEYSAYVKELEGIVTVGEEE